MKASTDEQLDRLTNYIISTGDMKGISEGQAIIIGKTRAGVFSPEESSQLQQGWQRKTVKGYWERKILENPVLANKILNKKTEPESFRFIEEDDKTKIKKAARTAAEGKLDDQTLQIAYTNLINKYGDNYEAALSNIRNPKWQNRNNLDFKTSGILESRFEGLLSQREKIETTREDALEDQQKENSYNAWIKFEKGELKPGEAILMAQNRDIPESTFRAITKAQREGVAENNPMVLFDIITKAELGIDVREDIKEAVEGRSLTTRTAAQWFEKSIDKQYNEGLYFIKNSFGTGADILYSQDKKSRFAEAVNLYNTRIRAGEKPYIKVASDIVASYLGEMRRTEQAQRKPKYAVYDKGVLNIQDTMEKTTDAFIKGSILAEEYKLEIELIQRLYLFQYEREQNEPLSKEIDSRVKDAFRESQ
jgi:hypothetical protein